jgi:hypothetical protein
MTREQNDPERDRIERSLDKAFEQEPRRQHNYFRSRERLALKLAMVGTDEEARIARGFLPSKPEVVQPEPAWRPADGGES